MGSAEGSHSVQGCSLATVVEDSVAVSAPELLVGGLVEDEVAAREPQPARVSVRTTKREARIARSVDEERASASRDVATVATGKREGPW
jgi:hypothetical protein